METESSIPPEFCEICHAGSLHPHRATYARWHAGHFVVMPRVPAWRCDVCGDTFYDGAALAHLTLLLGAEMGAENPRRRHARGPDEHVGTGLSNRRPI